MNTEPITSTGGEVNPLPKKKWNSPISRIVCWKCKEGQFDPRLKAFGMKGKTLLRVKEKDGKKSNDYICISCKSFGFYEPDIWNTSEVKIDYEFELGKLVL